MGNGCFGGGEESKPPTPSNTLKVLCLGIGGCGKTTFVKQIRIIHRIPWTDVEMTAFRKIVRSNIIIGLQNAINVAKELEKDLGESAESCKAIQALGYNSDLTDPGVQEIVKRFAANQVILDICTNNPEKLDQTHLLYFLERLPNYITEEIPLTIEEILRSRQRTIGASSTMVYFKKKYFEFYDVGGQKPERAKWQALLTGNKFSVIVYFVATDEFDVIEKDFEDTKLELSQLIFSELVSDDIIRNSGIPIMLMLNRSDIFRKRFEEDSGRNIFKEVYSEFQGETVEDAQKFLEKKFMGVRDGGVNEIFAHHTCTLDTESMKAVWGSIRDAVLIRGLDLM